jgi:hypothetical protein
MHISGTNSATNMIFEECKTANCALVFVLQIFACGFYNAAMHFNPIVIDVGKALMQSVVRHCCAALKYSV